MGSGFYLRDEFGNFLLAKIGYWNSQVLVQEGDAFALLQAMKIFETHGKQLVGHLHGPKSLLTESRILIQQIRNVLHQHSGFQRIAAKAMASAREQMYLMAILLIFSPSKLTLSNAGAVTGQPIPPEWPHQFHAFMFMNESGILQKLDLWYDWPNGRNFNIIQNQLDHVVSYDLEWTNGTSFVYTLDPSDPTCKVVDFGVGILRPNWLDGATYLGQQHVDNFLCNVWAKVDFIVYYEEVLTRRPVRWDFSSGYTGHVMTFEVGAVLEDANWQAPVYCFDENEKEKNIPILGSAVRGGSLGSLMREIPTGETM
ncbi:Uncharacterized protein GmHk_04G011456 [Glycine max]|nr:Uncharacterized protein GmHk_04G011456 [Glycine max]